MSYNEFFMITQSGKVNFGKEEQIVIKEMSIGNADFFIHPEVGNVIFRNMDDAIAVAKELIKRMPQLKLAVVKGIASGD